MLTGALVSTGVGLLGVSWVIKLLSGTALVSAVIYLAGKRLLTEPENLSQTPGFERVH
jgi:hypothetical protein